MTDFIFDENKIKKALITYCNKVNELYKAGNVILTDNVSWRFYQKGETKMYNGLFC